ncbi:MAG TPA: hypothetical protein VHU40_02420 [Polyangia bacterium]|nr:hypothetical protein [Polyangia bacterium]
MQRLSIFIAVGTTMFTAAVALAAAPVAPPVPRAPPTSSRLTTDIALVDITGATLERQTRNTTIGAKETLTAKKANRTVICDATFAEGDRIGCVKVDLKVTDRSIDSTGHFSRTEWTSSIQTCDAIPLTVGQKDQVRVRISVDRH